jgi:hypothetical protein
MNQSIHNCCSERHSGPGLQRMKRLHYAKPLQPLVTTICSASAFAYSLTYRDLEEIMAEQNLAVDHVRSGAGSSAMRPF